MYFVIRSQVKFAHTVNSIEETYEFLQQKYTKMKQTLNDAKFSQIYLWNGIFDYSKYT